LAQHGTIRKFHLETLNNFASRMGKATDEACSALTQVANYMAQSYDAIAEKHHCMILGIRYGLMLRT